LYIAINQAMMHLNAIKNGNENKSNVAIIIKINSKIRTFHV